MGLNKFNVLNWTKDELVQDRMGTVVDLMQHPRGSVEFKVGHMDPLGEIVNLFSLSIQYGNSFDY